MGNPLRESLKAASDIDMIREDIIGELEAINQYQKHIDAATSQRVKGVLSDIRDEEKVHVGELFMLLFTVDKTSAIAFKDGFAEVIEFLKDRKDPESVKAYAELCGK